MPKSQWAIIVGGWREVGRYDSYERAKVESTLLLSTLVEIVEIPPSHTLDQFIKGEEE